MGIYAFDDRSIYQIYLSYQRWTLIGEQMHYWNVTIYSNRERFWSCLPERIRLMGGGGKVKGFMVGWGVSHRHIKSQKMHSSEIIMFSSVCTILLKENEII